MTYDLGLLEQNRERWASSPALRWIYGTFYKRLREWSTGHEVLEIGSGIGGIKENWPEVTTSDVVRTRFVERAVSAYAIEASGHWDSIVALDVLHHLREPIRFFHSARQALRPAGRLVLIEPAATTLGGWLYRRCHHEPCEPSVLNPPFVFDVNQAEDGFANMGMGSALFVVHREWTEAQLARLGLRLRVVEWHELLAYLMTGGYSRRLPFPLPVLKGLHRMEAALPATLTKSCATRMCVVLEAV